MSIEYVQLAPAGDILEGRFLALEGGGRDAVEEDLVKLKTDMLAKGQRVSYKDEYLQPSSFIRIDVH
jgi:hypothetical protein